MITIMIIFRTLSEVDQKELTQTDRRKRKLTSMQNALHPREDVDRLYLSRKEGGEGVASIEDSVDTSMKLLRSR